MHWTNKLRDLHDLPSQTPTICILFQRPQFEKKKKKRQNPSVGKYVCMRITAMRITAKAGETYNILETGKCNLGL